MPKGARVSDIHPLYATVRRSFGEERLWYRARTLCCNDLILFPTSLKSLHRNGSKILWLAQMGWWGWGGEVNNCGMAYQVKGQWLSECPVAFFRFTMNLLYWSLKACNSIRRFWRLFIKCLVFVFSESVEAFATGWLSERKFGWNSVVVCSWCTVS